MKENNISYKEAMTAAKTSYQSSKNNGPNMGKLAEVSIESSKTNTAKKTDPVKMNNISKSRKNVQLAFDDVFADNDIHPEDDDERSSNHTHSWYKDCNSYINLFQQNTKLNGNILKNYLSSLNIKGN